jgi:RimJ/RimL family protein N-acetyltransferase
MSIVFYRREAAPAPADPQPGPGIEIDFWKPARDGRPRGLFAGRTNLAWWLIDKLGLFSGRDLTVVAVHRDGKPLHRLLVSPKWYRFPDMRAGDLQMGMLWTAPEARGQGFARLAIEAVHARFAGGYERMWYLVEEDNHASRRLIESFGYREVGRGTRTAPFGLAPVGQFVMTTPEQ